MEMAIEIDMTSNALNKNTQLSTRKTPQRMVLNTSFLFHTSDLCPPVMNHKPPKKSVAQIQRTNTSSTAGRPVFVVKKPIDPKIAIERVNFKIEPMFKRTTPTLLKINLLVYTRTCPVPVMKYFVEVNAGKPIGPRACSFCVEIPISAP